jgi:hypothetical protein
MVFGEGERPAGEMLWNLASPSAKPGLSPSGGLAVL